MNIRKGLVLKLEQNATNRIDTINTAQLLLQHQEIENKRTKETKLQN